MMQQKTELRYIQAREQAQWRKQDLNKTTEGEVDARALRLGRIHAHDSRSSRHWGIQCPLNSKAKSTHSSATSRPLVQLADKSAEALRGESNAKIFTDSCTARVATTSSSD